MYASTICIIHTNPLLLKVERDLFVRLHHTILKKNKPTYLIYTKMQNDQKLFASSMLYNQIINVLKYKR